MSPEIHDFEAAAIDVAKFNHAEHIQMGWRYLVAYGVDRGSRKFRDALKRLTKKVGAQGKYHETITTVFLMEIADRLDGSDWTSFRAANADLFDTRAVLDRLYLPETLASDEARLRFVSPDRHGFDPRSDCGQAR